MSNSRTLADIIGSAGTPAISSNASFSANVAVTGTTTLSGAVAVGACTSPTMALDVYKSSSNAQVKIYTGGSTSVPQLELRNTQAGCQIGMPADTNAMNFVTADNERARIDLNGNFLLGTTAQSNNVTAQLTIKTNDYTKPAIQIMGSDNNWWGRMSHSVSGGTQGTFISSGGAWSVTGTTYSATKDYDGSFPTTAAFISSQWNSSAASSFAVLTKAGGSTKTDGTVSTLLGINTSGHMTVPYQPSFIYWQGDTNTTYNPTSASVVTFRGTLAGAHNRGSHYSTSTGRFTAPVAGVYHFDLHWIAAISTTSTEQNYGIRVNGTTIADSRGRGYTESSPNISINLYLNASDYVDVAKQDGDGKQMYTSGLYSYFSGYLVG